MRHFALFFLSTVLFFISGVKTGMAQCPGGMKLNIKAVPSTLRTDTLPPCPSGGWCRESICGTIGLVPAQGDYEITGFIFAITDLCNDNSGDLHEVVCTGNQFNSRVKYLINRACKGTTISFDCVMAKNKAGQVFKLEPFSVTLQ